MTLTTKLKEIATSLKLNDVLAEVQFIEERLNNSNKQIVIPIVGEFSSGKTTLINTLTESKKLETASKPTTSVVYEIFFGQEEEYAEVIFNNQEIQKIEDISELKNDEFNEVSFVRIYDTSAKVPDSVVLVDTPGLSSNDPKHLEALSEYLPNADALILCVDANQQITNTLINFLKLNNLSYLPVYLVITKSDTKTENEIKQIKEYISKSIELPYENLICISSLSNELEEFYNLMNEIQIKKNEIVDGILNFKLEKIKEYLKTYILNLLENSTSDKQIEVELKEQSRELDRLKFAINKLVQDTSSELEEVEYQTVNSFKKIVFDKLEQVISKRSLMMDQDAIGVINGTSTIVMSNYQNEVRKKLWQLAKDRKNTDLGIPLRSLDEIDTSVLNIDSLSYDINLSAAGQNSVKNISTGIKVLGAVAAVAAVVATAGAASAGVAGAGAAGTGAATSAAAGAAGSAAGSAAATVATTTKLAKVASVATKVTKVTTTAMTIKNGLAENMQKVEVHNQELSGVVGMPENEGFIEGIVGKVGDSSLGKPQRKKLINEYLDYSLLPEFKMKLSGITQYLLQDIQNNLQNEAQFKIEQLEARLNEIKNLMTQDANAFKIEMNNYKKFIEILNN